MKLHILLILLLLSSTVCSQSIVTGKVVEYEDNTPIEFAAIRIYNMKDSTFVRATGTEQSGKFKLHLNSGIYILEAKCLGFNTKYINFDIRHDVNEYEIPIIYLETQSIELDEAVVIAKTNPTVVKGDTIIYNARSFNPGPSDNLEDLIRKIPEIEIDGEGNISTNGKIITKIMINGKEFFGANVQIALKNIPAEMINKLELYNEESYIARLTGIKDRDENKVINLTIKKEYEETLSGNLEAGYGSSDHYQLKGMANYMRNNNQFILLTNNSNIDNKGKSGSLDENNIGTNISIENSKNVKASASLQYTDSDQSNTILSNQEIITSEDSRINNSIESYKSKQGRLDLLGMLEWHPDSLTTIYQTIYFAHWKPKVTSLLESTIFEREKKQTETESDKKSIDSNNYTYTQFSIGRKLNTVGRNITFSPSFVGWKRDIDGSNYYTKSLLTNTIVTDQQTYTTSNNNTLNLYFSFVEPISENSSLQVAYIYKYDNNKRLNEVYNRDSQGNYSLLDSTYSRNTIRKYSEHTIELNWQKKTKKMDMVVGFRAIPSLTKDRISLKDSLLNTIRTPTVGYAPRLDLNYRVNKSTTLDMKYDGYSGVPDNLNEISSDTIYVNASTKTYGNINLKRSYTNNATINFNTSSIAKRSFLQFILKFSNTWNKVANYTYIKPDLSTVTTYRNVNGVYRIRLGINYRKTINNVILSTNTTIIYDKDKAYVNDELGIMKNYTIQQKFNLNYTYQRLDLTVEPDISHTISDNSLLSMSDIKVTQYGLYGNLKLTFPYNIIFSSNIKFSKNMGFDPIFDPNNIMWQGQIEKSFLKNKEAIIKFSANNILNEKSNVTRTTTGTNINYRQSNNLGRFFMLSFTYKFTTMLNKKQTS